MTPTLSEWGNNTDSPAEFHFTSMKSSPVLSDDRQLLVTSPPPAPIGRGESVSAEEFLRAFLPTGQILYGGSIHPRLRTVRAFRVRFERRENGFVAFVPELEEFGVGNTTSGALDDLRRTLAELYFSLARDEDRLSEALGEVWRVLRTHVVPIRP